MGSAILCIGEVLWDALPSGLFLGGAPFNVSCHLNELEEEVSFASRAGNDRLGKEVARRIKDRGMSAGLLQTDHSLETGFVEVELDSSGHPDYRIIEPAAWDAIEMKPALEKRAAAAEAITDRTGALRDAVRAA